jgi:exopolysaccharide biosynthesis polyprenyl glycosylphosphotransferase
VTASQESATDNQVTVAARPDNTAATVELTGRRRTMLPSRINLGVWVFRLVALDAVAVSLALVTGYIARFGSLSNVASRTVDYRFLALVLVPTWLAAMAFAGSYDSRFIAAGPEQYRRVVNGAVWVLAFAAFVSFALHADLSRGFILASIPLATILTLAVRYGARTILHRKFAGNRSAHRVVIIGLPPEVRDLASHMRRASYAGFRVVAALTPGEPGEPSLPAGVFWAGSDLDAAVHRAQEFGADTIAVGSPQLLAGGRLRRLSWDLEGTDIDLMLAPAITDIAGPRIRIRPVDGLPLLCVEKPQFHGPRRFTKEAIDRTAGVVLLTLLAPLFAGVAIGVRLTSSGPAMFRQTRVGKDGRQFALLKFRSMRVGAPGERPDAGHVYEGSDLPFKARQDPRVTPVGRVLRRYSIDELPQLWNVVSGQMSLVGPRPLVPAEVDGRGTDFHRRLLVKPGMTGLWQVSGRSEVSWDERMRMDLHYVDNWSVGLDLVLLWKTFASVIRGRGAY